MPRGGSCEWRTTQSPLPEQTRPEATGHATSHVSPALSASHAQETCPSLKRQWPWREHDETASAHDDAQSSPPKPASQLQMPRPSHLPLPEHARPASRGHENSHASPTKPESHAQVGAASLIDAQAPWLEHAPSAATGELEYTSDGSMPGQGMAQSDPAKPAAHVLHVSVALGPASTSTDKSYVLIAPLAALSL